MQIEPHIRGVFFDDQKSNFEDNHLCPSVLDIHSRLGRRDKEVIKRFPLLRDWEKEAGGPIFYRDAGLPYEVLKRWKQYLVSSRSDHIRLVFFDFDRTLSTWDGLAGDDTAPWIQESREESTWEKQRDTMFISPERTRLIAELLSILQAQRRVSIVTNQGENRGIKAVLQALAEDFALPNLTQVPVMALKERKNISKYEFFLKKLKSQCQIPSE